MKGGRNNVEEDEEALGNGRTRTDGEVIAGERIEFINFLQKTPPVHQFVLYWIEPSIVIRKGPRQYIWLTFAPMFPPHFLFGQRTWSTSNRWMGR